MVELIEGFLLSWGYWGFFAIIILEEIVVPIPSSLVMMGAGFFLIRADLSLSQAIAEISLKLAPIGGLGVSLGSLFLFFLGYYGGEFLIQKVGPKIGFSIKAIEKIRSYFKGNYWDELMVLFLKAVPIFPGAAVSVLAGILKMNSWRFFLASFFGAGLRIFIMALIGWQAKEAYYVLSSQFEGLSNLIFLIFALGSLVGYFLLKKKLDS